MHFYLEQGDKSLNAEFWLATYKTPLTNGTMLDVDLIPGNNGKISASTPQQKMRIEDLVEGQEYTAQELGIRGITGKWKAVGYGSGSKAYK